MLGSIKHMVLSSPRPKGSSKSISSSSSASVSPRTKKKQRLFARAQEYTARVQARVCNWLSVLDVPAQEAISMPIARIDQAHNPEDNVIKAESAPTEPVLYNAIKAESAPTEPALYNVPQYQYPPSTVASPEAVSYASDSLGGPPSVTVNFDEFGKVVECIYTRSPRSRPVTPDRVPPSHTFSSPSTSMQRKRKSRDNDEGARRASKRGKIALLDGDFFHYLRNPEKFPRSGALAESTHGLDELPSPLKRAIKRKRTLADEGDEYVLDGIEHNKETPDPDVSLPPHSPEGPVTGSKIGHGNRSRAPSPSTAAKTASPRKRVKLTLKLTLKPRPSTPSVYSTSTSSSRSSSPETPTKPGRKREESPEYAPSTSSEDEEVSVSRRERESLLYILTKEKALRLSAAFKVPGQFSMGNEEKNLYLGMALRGCKPVMASHWRKDFTTLPESLFAPETDDDDAGSTNPILKALGRSEFTAIRAFKDLLKVGANVRDCRYLTVEPQAVTQKAIHRFLRWAIDDHSLKSSPETIPVHAVHVQGPGQETVDCIKQLTEKLERLARCFQDAFSGSLDAWWPTLVGFSLCGPVMTVVSLDTNPECSAWGGSEDTPVKIIGHFDLTERDEDVWNALAIAIGVIHTRDTMAHLASVYAGSRVPHFLSESDKVDDKDL